MKITNILNDCLKIISNAFIGNVGVLPFNELEFFDNKKEDFTNIKAAFVFTKNYYTAMRKNQNLSAYCVLPDYHITFLNELNEICKKLKETFPENLFYPFCDISPIFEKNAAAKAGLGVLGKNNMLLTNEGSFVFIGEILTDLVFDLPKSNYIINYCEGCNKCVEACPTNALGNNFEKEKCLSYITQKKGNLTAEEENSINQNGYVWGCDICQRVCPHNLNLNEIKENNLIFSLNLNDINDLTVSQFREKYKDRAFIWRGADVIKRNLNILKKG